MNRYYELEGVTGQHGLVGVLGYDADSGSYSPREWAGNLWTMISNTRSEQIAIDDSIDLDYFYGEEDLTEHLREYYAAHLIVPVRYESHGPQGRYLAQDLVKPRELVRGPWSFEALAVASLEDLRSEGIRLHEAALDRLRDELDTYSQWSNGHVYGYVIRDRHGDVVASCGDLYELDYALKQMRQALRECEQDAAIEKEAIGYWAARDVVTTDRACTAAAARWQ